MKVRAAALVATLALAAPVAAGAQPVTGLYVCQGGSRSDIVVSAYGETRPLVPTADGVRAPQNRRVEIVLR
jgi:OOP family OmpA-OmpF porin